MLAKWVPESLSDVILCSVFLAGRAKKPVRRPNHISVLEDQGQKAQSLTRSRQSADRRIEQGRLTTSAVQAGSGWTRL